MSNKYDECKYCKASEMYFNNGYWQNDCDYHTNLTDCKADRAHYDATHAIDSDSMWQIRILTKNDEEELDDTVNIDTWTLDGVFDFIDTLEDESTELIDVAFDGLNKRIWICLNNEVRT